MRCAGWRLLAAAWIPLLGLVSVGRAEVTSSPDRSLRFVGSGGVSRVVTLQQMLEACGSVEVDVEDPYHEQRMRYAALLLRCVLDVGFADSGGAGGLLGQGLILRARDGYTRPVSGAVLLEPGGVLAYGEPDLEPSGSGALRFSPIGRRRVDPAPFYLVWTGDDQNDPHELPWPYQLVTIEVAPFAEAFPHTAPEGVEGDDPAWVGYAIFQRACASCHAINGEGGTVGPELNVPRNIVEYRPLDQIRAYIRDPESFRYTTMPAHPGLSEADLDALIAYFLAMRERKHDPRTRGGG
jgi:mono/diheme cytochrome c family protein